MTVLSYSTQLIPPVADDVSAQLTTIYVGFVAFTILMWDHIDTFTAEVEYIWKRDKVPLTYLFLLNRYLTPLGFIVNLFAYLSPVWKPEVRHCLSWSYGGLIICRRFIRYEGAMTMIGINVVAAMMYLRVYAFYQSRRPILFGVAFILFCQISVNAWLLTHGEAVVHNMGSTLKSCTMIFDPSLSAAASSSAWLPLLYDTVVFSLLAYRIIPIRRSPYQGYTTRVIMKRLFEDGLIYYIVICTVTLVLTLMIVFAKPGSKNITAQLELLLTVTMMSRITLSMKKSVANIDQLDPDTLTLQIMPSFALTGDGHSPRSPLAACHPSPARETPKRHTSTFRANTVEGELPSEPEFHRCQETLQLRPLPV